MVLWKNLDNVGEEIGNGAGSAGLYLKEKRKVRYVKYGPKGRETGEVLLPPNIVTEEDARMYVMYKHPELKADIRESQRRSRDVFLSEFDRMMEEREILELLNGGGYPRNYVTPLEEPSACCDTEIVYAGPDFFGVDIDTYVDEIYAPPEFFEREREDKRALYSRLDERRKKEEKK